MSETLPSLTANGQKLIDRLLTLPQGWVTAAMLAESIGVSRRTVLRELPSVEQWIAAAGYRFVRSCRAVSGGKSCSVCCCRRVSR